MTIFGESGIELIEQRIHRRIERVFAVQNRDLHDLSAFAPSTALV